MFSLSSFYTLVKKKKVPCWYLKLKGVAMTQGQVPRDSHPIPIRASKHHGRGRWGTEAVIAFPLHAFITKHQPHAHLVQRVVECRLLVKVL